MVDEPNPGQEKAAANADNQQENAARSLPKLPEGGAESKESKNDTNATKPELSALSNILVSLRKVLFSLDFWTAAATVVMAITTIVYTFYAKKQWREMQRSFSLSQEQLALTDRPWVEIVDASTSKSSLTTGIVFWPNMFLPHEKPQARLGFGLTYKNVGHSAAVDIRVNPELYIMKFYEYSDNKAVQVEEDRFCSLPVEDAVIETSGKAILFPDETSVSGQGVGGLITLENSFYEKDRGMVVSPILIVCVNYRYQSSPIWHQTRAAFDLWSSNMPQDIPRPHLFGTWVMDDPTGMKTPDVTLQRIEADDYAD